MQGLPGYGFSYSGVLLIGIFQGLSVLADDAAIVYRPTGGSLDLSLNYTKDSKLTVRWKFHGETFAEYKSNQYSYMKSQFSGRLKEKQDQVGIIVQNLQSNDGGEFLIVATVSQQQQPTKTIKVFIENPISDVQIEKNQTWMESTNSCVINLNCRALGAESPSYSWSGYKNESGAQVQFTLSPVDRPVTMTCTATNNVSTESASETLTCSSDQTQTGTITTLVWYAVGCAAILPVAVILGVICFYRKCSKKPAADNEITVYADVNPGVVAQKNGRSASVNNGMSVYETVDDFRVAPDMTVYAKVAFPKRQEPSATRPSAYQQAS